MKRHLLSAVLLLGVFLAPLAPVYAVHVSGYYRSNGTYVHGYERTAPDSNPYNNYSYPGNYNPNTGTITKGNPSTYLNEYYNKSSTNVRYSAPTHASYTAPAASISATALCRDYTYSYALNHSGACSHHGGVMRWYR